MSCIGEKLIALKLMSAKFPFLVAAAGGVQINTARIVEALLIAALTGGGTYSALKSDIDHLRDQQAQMRDDLRQLRQDLYVPRSGYPEVRQ
jgi:hypothetical protein